MKQAVLTVHSPEGPYAFLWGPAISCLSSPHFYWKGWFSF